MITSTSLTLKERNCNTQKCYLLNVLRYLIKLYIINKYQYYKFSNSIKNKTYFSQIITAVCLIVGNILLRNVFFQLCFQIYNLCAVMLIFYWTCWWDNTLVVIKTNHIIRYLWVACYKDYTCRLIGLGTGKIVKILK